MNVKRELRVLLLSVDPPQNDMGVRVVLYRHLYDRKPFDVLIATHADFYHGSPPGIKLKLPWLPQKVKKSRFGPALIKWILDYQNLIWVWKNPLKFERAIFEFKPQVILAVADTSLCCFAAKAARKYGVPLAGLFLDWFPVMKGHYGHLWTQSILNKRFRQFYRKCDLAFCTSDGMQEVLGPHSNSHVIYPMPGSHKPPSGIFPEKNGKFRLVYVGSVEQFYGRALCSLINEIISCSDLELIVVGPNADWPEALLKCARERGIYIGFKPPHEAASVLAGADALLVIMSFEPEHKLFMQTSFTTKFLDYTAFAKPIVFWGPDYCTPVRVVQREGGAVVVNTPDARKIVAVCREIANDSELQGRLSAEARKLNETLFNPERIQNIFVTQIEKVANSKS